MENSERNQPDKDEGKEKYSPAAYLIMLFTVAIVLVLLSYFAYENNAGGRFTGLDHHKNEMTAEQTGDDFREME